MGDHANQDDLTAAMAHMQQQMQQLQQTIQAQEQAAQQQQEQAAQQQREQQAQTIDGLTAKVDQLLKNNQGHVFSMEQATAEQIQNQNQRQSQSNRQAVPATENNQPDELKGLGMMMQQLLQGQQVQAKALNQVTTEIDTRIGNMFTKLNAKYDTLAIHIRKIDVQLAQTVESVKRQQWTLPGKIDKNPRTEHCNAIEQPFAETVLGAEENTEQSASSGATAPSEHAETLPVRVYVPMVPYPIPPKHLMDPIRAEQLAGFRKMLEIVPKKELCKKGEIKEVLDGDPHTDTKKLMVSGEQLEIVPKKELCKKGEIKEVLDGDPHTDTKKLSGNVKLNEKVQKKRVKADPMMTLIPRLCDEKSIEYEVKCKGTLNLSLNSE
ncbi:hypothetical protein DY000_02009340 [Brassica cretica]|uniref:Uncharacterized protein n=1 Tax=Brassica cretica TaxID=69181 RepID=A0ABQ7CCN1_BRACR|nr:hypothetical protein DY000_02009340 [Brassica cretica]